MQWLDRTGRDFHVIVNHVAVAMSERAELH